MTDSPDYSTQDSQLNGGRVLLVVVVVGLLAVVVWGFLHFRSQSKQSEDALAKVLSDNQELQKQMANLKATIADVETAELYQKEQQTLAKDETTMLRQRISRAERELLTIAQLQQSWTSSIDQLKDGENGRHVASDPALVDLLATILFNAPNRLRPLRPLGWPRNLLNHPLSLPPPAPSSDLSRERITLGRWRLILSHKSKKRGVRREPGDSALASTLCISKLETTSARLA